jgi:hypothetical protein
MAKLKEIVLHFENYDFGSDEIKLDECSQIKHLKTFVHSHISMLKANPGKPVYLPYYERLKKVYLITKI